jgi:hypothetical protein
VVVEVGDTVCDPLTATDVPFSFALAAFVEDHVRVELLPGATVAGFALMLAVGVPLVEPTVTTTLEDVVAPAALLAMKV